MSALTDAGREAVRNGAARYGVSEQAAEALLHAVIRGNGTMAQFNIQELGGSGQWLAGGMTMVGDMFNHGLQATVSGLASDLSQAMNNARLVEAPKAGNLSAAHGWWPEELGLPSSTGGQNDISYAVFPSTRRLAIRFNNQLHLFDTGDHMIGGVSQSQNGIGLSTLSFQSQQGTLAVTQLRPISEPDSDAADIISEPAAQTQPDNGDRVFEPAHAEPTTPVSPEPAPASQPALAATPASATQNRQQAAVSSDIDVIIATIEKLAMLRDKGALTDSEFDTKKIELLARL
jgi:hypothetical protein